MAGLRKLHAFLVELKRLLQGKIGILQLPNDVVQALEISFEVGCLISLGRLGHLPILCASYQCNSIVRRAPWSPVPKGLKVLNNSWEWRGAKSRMVEWLSKTLDQD